MSTRFASRGRLCYFREHNTMDWDEHWAYRIHPGLYQAPAQLGFLSFLADYLPRNGPILEAGCGTGVIVHKLRLLGFDCRGVDNAAKTIAAVRSIMPDLPVTAGNVLALDAPDGHYSAYVSLGVVEHREQGPEPFLEEAHRVLAEDGIAIFTVPFFNGLRRLKASCGLFSTPPGQHETFYQYAFTAEEFAGILTAKGFRIVEQRGYDPVKGLRDEIRILRRLSTPAVTGGSTSRLATPATHPSPTGHLRSIKTWIENQRWFHPIAAHMLATICKKA